MLNRRTRKLITIAVLLIVFFQITAILHFPWFLIALGLYILYSIIKDNNFFMKRDESYKKEKQRSRGHKHNSDINFDNEWKKTEKKMDQNTRGKDKNKKNTQNVKNKENFQNVIAEAMKIKSVIEKQIKSSPHLKEKYGEKGMDDILEKYISQIKQLIQRHQELMRLIDSISTEEDRKQIDKLTRRYEKTTDEKLRMEYLKSIAQYKRHIASSHDLAEQQEVIGLKIQSAVMSLKQLQLDNTRMQELINDEEDYAFKAFEERTEDLSNYVNNLDKSYNDLERDL